MCRLSKYSLEPASLPPVVFQVFPLSKVVYEMCPFRGSFQGLVVASKLVLDLVLRA